MSAQPIHHGDPEDPRDPQGILARLPEQERGTFLLQYHQHVQALVADELAGYRKLQTFLDRWSGLASVLERRLSENPSCYEDLAAEIEGVRSGSVQTVPIEDVVPDWVERVAAAKGRRQS